MLEASERGYRLGRFQGWSALALGLIVYLIALFAHSGVSRFQLYVAGGVLMVAGVGLLRKTRTGFVLLYVLAGLATVRAVTNSRPSIDDFVTQWAFFCWWAIPALLYYPKRYKEFGFRRKVKAVLPERMPVDYLKPMRDLTDEERATVLEHLRHGVPKEKQEPMQ